MANQQFGHFFGPSTREVRSPDFPGELLRVSARFRLARRTEDRKMERRGRVLGALLVLALAALGCMRAFVASTAPSAGGALGVKGPETSPEMMFTPDE